LTKEFDGGAKKMYNCRVAIITKLAAQKKNNERIAIFVDDEFFCGLSIDDVVRNGLVAGMEVTDEFMSNLYAASVENEFYNKALVYILRSPHTEVEIRRFLIRKKKCSPQTIEKIIARLKTMNYINDQAYAKMFALSKHVRVSARAIKMKLKNKGVCDEIVSEATVDIGNQDALAQKTAEKYMRWRESDAKNLQKLFRYLVSKGFEYDIVNEIISEYKGGGCKNVSGN
jgi:regulatory protein